MTVQHEPVKPRIHITRYNRRDLSETEAAKVEQIREALAGDRVVWIDIQGLGDPELPRALGEIFSLHPLVVADITDTPQRPKCEWHEDHIFLITRNPVPHSRGRIGLEQVSVFLGKNYVLTVQENYSSRLQRAADRLHGNVGDVRRHGADYLAYMILDTLSDGYYEVLDDVADYLEDLEQEAMEDPTDRTLMKSNQVRASLVHMRRAVWPQREALAALSRRESPLVSASVAKYLYDVHEEFVQISELIESYREIASSVNNTYLSSLSNRTNEVMKVLTIMASLFIPLTFIAGIYGMNFEYMPELAVHWGYFAVWGVMLTTAAGMLLYFRRKGWIGGARPPSMADDDSET
jgi:magnesium transporter